MSTIINADTSDGLKLTSDTSGEIQLQSAGTTIATVDSTGIAMASGKTIQNASGDVVANTPAFSATITSTQSLSETTATKLDFDTEDFDTDSAFDTSTNRFTVPAGKAGLYSISGLARIDSELSNNLLIAIFYIYKNGANHKRSYQYYANNYIRSSGICVTSVMDLAVGDYIELYGYINTVDNTGGQVNQGIDSTFCGHRLIT